MKLTMYIFITNRMIDRIIINCFFIFSIINGLNAQVNEIKKNSTTNIKRTYRFDQLPNNGLYTIELENISADIKIIGENGLGAKILISQLFFDIPEKDLQEIHKLAKTIVTYLENQQLIRISGHLNNNINSIQQTIELRLPNNINLNFDLLGGDIELKNINGESIIKTGGGDIIINNYYGNIEAKTDGGDVSINMLDGILKSHTFGGYTKLSKSKGELSLSSIGGDIDMFELIGNINCQSSGGSVSLINIKGNRINCQSSGGSIEGNDLKGNITFYSSGEKINLSEIEGNIELESSGGLIRIENSKGSVKCKTSSGNIEMFDITGNIESLNSSGDILLDFLYDSSIENNSIYMETHSGNISINIPKGLPSNIESTIYQTTSIKNLNSEIPLNIITAENKVIGTRVIDSGTIPIKLKVHHGIITIKES